MYTWIPRVMPDMFNCRTRRLHLDLLAGLYLGCWLKWTFAMVVPKKVPAACDL